MNARKREKWDCILTYKRTVTVEAFSLREAEEKAFLEYDLTTRGGERISACEVAISLRKGDANG